MKKVPIGHSFYAYTCSTCRGRLLETFELMQEDRDLDGAKAELDTIFERILIEYAHNGSVINDEAPRFERDVQKYFYYALHRSIRCGKIQEDESRVLRHSPLRPVIRTRVGSGDTSRAACREFRCERFRSRCE